MNINYLTLICMNINYKWGGGHPPPQTPPPHIPPLSHHLIHHLKKGARSVPILLLQVFSKYGSTHMFMTCLHPAERSCLTNRMAYRPVYSHVENSDHRFTHNCGRLCVIHAIFTSPRRYISRLSRADGAKRRARVLIPPGYLHPGKGKH
jgi:hypothetical protein